jgi:transglutaminase-like putative cysteine protease
VPRCDSAKVPRCDSAKVPRCDSAKVPGCDRDLRLREHIVQFNIRHVTKFIYEAAISESVMEARVQPRSEGTQRCLRFALSTMPASRVRMYRDHDGNVVHHFNIPGRLSRLSLVADALVESVPGAVLPEEAGPGAWERLDDATATGAFWEMLNPSPIARPTERLLDLAEELGLARNDDPLTTLRRLNTALYSCMTYSPNSTRVDSPIDDALESRRGVCQDFTHIMIALVRQLRIPCRYVSGYLFQQGDEMRAPEGATHAWVEAWLPDLEWVGFDPTNNLVADHRHIRVAVGRDYTDVPPTRGVFKGASAVRSELSVSVQIGAAASLSGDVATPLVPWISREVTPSLPRGDAQQ